MLLFQSYIPTNSVKNQNIAENLQKYIKNLQRAVSVKPVSAQVRVSIIEHIISVEFLFRNLRIRHDQSVDPYVKHACVEGVCVSFANKDNVAPDHEPLVPVKLEAFAGVENVISIVHSSHELNKDHFINLRNINR